MTPFKRQTTFTKSVRFNGFGRVAHKPQLHPTATETESQLYSRLLQRNVTTLDAALGLIFFIFFLHESGSQSLLQEITQSRHKGCGAVSRVEETM